MLIHKLIEDLKARGEAESPVPGMSNTQLAKELDGATLLYPAIEQDYIPGCGGTPEHPIPKSTWIEWPDGRHVQGWLVVPGVEEVDLWLAYQGVEGHEIGKPHAVVVSASPVSGRVAFQVETSACEKNCHSVARQWADVYRTVATHHSGLAADYDDDFFFVDVA